MFWTGLEARRIATDVDTGVLRSRAGRFPLSGGVARAIPAFFTASFLFGGLAAQPSLAQERLSKAEADALCNVGKAPPLTAVSEWSAGLNPKANDLTPATVPGATRISPKEYECLYMKAYGPKAIGGQMVIIAPINDGEVLHYSNPLPGGGRGGSFNDETQGTMLRPPDKGRPPSLSNGKV